MRGRQCGQCEYTRMILVPDTAVQTLACVAGRTRIGKREQIVAPALVHVTLGAPCRFPDKAIVIAAVQGYERQPVLLGFGDAE